MKCPSCGNKAWPGDYERCFVDHGTSTGLRIWQCRNCGEGLTHGLMTRSHLAPPQIRQQLALGRSRSELRFEIDLDRLRSELPNVSSERLDMLERLPGDLLSNEGLALIGDERLRRQARPDLTGSPSTSPAEPTATLFPTYDTARLQDLGYPPPIADAKALGLYQLGRYEATFLGAITSTGGPTRFERALAVDQEGRTVLFIAAEASDLHDECFLCVWDGKQHANLGADQPWDFVTVFLNEGLKIASERLGVHEAPSRIWGVPLSDADLGL